MTVAIQVGPIGWRRGLHTESLGIPTFLGGAKNKKEIIENSKEEIQIWQGNQGKRKEESEEDRVLRVIYKKSDV